MYYNGGFLGEMFEAKVRKVGTSFGVLLPKKIVENEKIKDGQTISVVILKKNLKLIDEAFGSTKGASSFERDRDDRF